MKQRDILPTDNKDITSEDEDYMVVLNRLISNTLLKELRKEPTASPLYSYLAVWEMLGILDDEFKA